MIRAMRGLWLLLIAWLATTAALAQAPAKGMLLVASPDMRDPRFAETVLLLLLAGPDGAVALAINRPTWVEPTTAFPNMDYLRRYRGGLYIGGPVARANVLVLVRDPEIEIPDTEPIVDGVYLSADPDYLRRIAPSAGTDRTLRLYAGHAEWQPGQLEQEIAGGSWHLVPANADLIFSQEPLELWQQVRVLESQMSVQLPAPGPAVAALP